MENKADKFLGWCNGNHWIDCNGSDLGVPDIDALVQSKGRLLMILTCERYELGDNYTHGEVWLEGDVERTHVCYSMEDTDRFLETGGVKVAGLTAIPIGVYKMVIDRSQRFGKDMIHLLNVPQFSGVRVHAGNTSENTEGCPLVGRDMPVGDWMGNSRPAAEKVFNMVRKELSAGNECYWKIVRR